jgi:ubiquinol-cytochrome c reductase cytochrome c1 subunit
MRAFFYLAFLLWSSAAAKADGEIPPLERENWSFLGITGTFDRNALQRGLQVYKEVCSTCHGLKRIRFRELKALGFSAEDIKTFAKTYEVTDGPNEEGEMFTRQGLPSDAFPNPFKNDQAARASNQGALPPDLSLIVKARAGGADYLYALLTTYSAPPHGLKLGDNMYYNPYFPGHQIAMPPPFVADQVTYADGTPATIDQMARDVTTFLAWASEPETEARKTMGWRVLMFVFVLTILLGFLMRKIWAPLGPQTKKE